MHDPLDALDAGIMGLITTYGEPPVMDPSENCYDLLREFEGLRLSAYYDGGGKLTIGFGHTGPDVTRNTHWTKFQADTALKADTAEAARGVNRLIGDHPTTQSQFDALCCFTFNLGATALSTSTLLRKHNAGDYAGAAAEFPRWDKQHVNGVLVEVPGLLKRRQAEAALYAL